MLPQFSPLLASSYELDGSVVAVLSVGGGILLMITLALISARKSVLKSREREQTRRELAAYVAEGTISPDDAVRMMSVGDKSKKQGDRC